MDAGPGTALGSVGWFTGVWATMMAAMMLPSLAPTAAVFAASVRRELSRVLLFAGGYLLVWSVAGIGAYGLFELGRSLFAGSLAWHSGGRWLAAGVLALAALYQLTPLKRAFLLRCRSPLRFLDASCAEHPARSARDGSAQRRMVSRMFVGPDGRAVRARCDEPHVDGVDRRARGAREGRTLGARRKVGDRGRPGRARGWRFSPCRTRSRGSSSRARRPHST